ncbi:MAG: PAS domain-containing protein [Candidatus Latescibacteria bacterium]|nr:PAS domain-containing protein [Candidatus Latescibacterota bacterium]
MNKRPARTRADDPATLRPGYLAALAGILALVLSLFAWRELGESRRAMLDTLEDGSVSLAQSIAKAGEHALQAEEEIQLLIAQRLQDNGHLIAALADRGGLDHEALDQLVDSASFGVDILDADGALLATSAQSGRATDLLPVELDAVLTGREEETFFWVPEDDFYALALSQISGGAVVVQATANWLLELRRTAGLGRLIQEIGTIGDQESLVYMVVQDTLGLLSASRGIETIGPIGDDPFLRQALQNPRPASRLTQFDGQEVFETVLPFAATPDQPRLLRVGLSLEKLRALESRYRLQLALLVGLLAVLGAVGAGIITVRQNYALLDEAYARVQTYSSRILERMGDAVVALDAQGRVQVFNQAAERLFERPVAQTRGRPGSDIFGAAMDALETSLVQGTELREAIFQGHLPSSRSVILALSTSRLEAEGGQGETWMVVIQDLTEKRALEADLRRQDRLTAMGALASGVAHEVRNPLNAISIIVQRLEREFAPAAEEKEEYRQLTGLVRDEIARVNRIVVDFLELARPPQLQRRRVDLLPLLEKAAQIAQPQAEAKSLRLQRHFASGGTLEADPDQLQQALLNLLGNAVEATQNGEVRFAARDRADGSVEITVTDTGSGIALENIERIFDLYFTTKPEGTGLGLGLVHRIITEHGGRLQVDSQPGHGSCFTILLPRGD